MEAILKRRSVRTYSDKPLTDEEINRLLKAAMRAPSAGNQQPWEFVVMRNRENLKAVKEFHPYSGMLANAQAAIVVCGNTEREIYEDSYWVQDCSAATENILIQASGMGIGSCWLGIYPTEERIKGMQQLLKLPEHVIPLSVVSLGYPQKEPAEADTFKAERIHQEQWQERAE